MKIFKLTK